METIRERLKEVMDTRNPLKRFKEMEELCGFSSATWNNIYHGKQKANEEHIDAVLKAFPQYRVWLGSGLMSAFRGVTLYHNARH